MRAIILATALLAATVPAASFAQAKFTTSTSTISALIADPAAKAVLEKHFAPIVGAADQVGSQTLKQLQGMAPDRITDKLLADIDADLAKIK